MRKKLIIAAAAGRRTGDILGGGTRVF